MALKLRPIPTGTLDYKAPNINPLTNTTPIGDDMSDLIPEGTLKLVGVLIIIGLVILFGIGIFIGSLL